MKYLSSIWDGKKIETIATIKQENMYLVLLMKILRKDRNGSSSFETTIVMIYVR